MSLVVISIRQLKKKLMLWHEIRKLYISYWRRSSLELAKTSRSHYLELMKQATFSDVHFPCRVTIRNLVVCQSVMTKCYLFERTLRLAMQFVVCLSIKCGRDCRTESKVATNSPQRTYQNGNARVWFVPLCKALLLFRDIEEPSSISNSDRE